MADRIPYKYTSIVKTSLIAAAAIAPVGKFGGLATVDLGATWTTMFLAIRDKVGSSLGVDPKRICSVVASYIVARYYGSKILINAFVLIPGVVSFENVVKIYNIYFTYSFAATLIELFEIENCSDDDIIRFCISHLMKLPNKEEVKEMIKIYQS